MLALQLVQLLLPLLLLLLLQLAAGCKGPRLLPSCQPPLLASEATALTASPADRAPMLPCCAAVQLGREGGDKEALQLQLMRSCCRHWSRVASVRERAWHGVVLERAEAELSAYVQ